MVINLCIDVLFRELTKERRLDDGSIQNFSVQYLTAPTATPLLNQSAFSD